MVQNLFQRLVPLLDRLIVGFKAGGLFLGPFLRTRLGLECLQLLIQRIQPLSDPLPELRGLGAQFVVAQTGQRFAEPVYFLDPGQQGFDISIGFVSKKILDHLVKHSNHERGVLLQVPKVSFSGGKVTP